MKVWVDSDELYPYFAWSITGDRAARGYGGGKECEVEEATVTRWRETLAAFNAMQTELEGLSGYES